VERRNINRGYRDAAPSAMIGASNRIEPASCDALAS
jgi:hypothetical protein